MYTNVRVRVVIFIRRQTRTRAGGWDGGIVVRTRNCLTFNSRNLFITYIYIIIISDVQIYACMYNI